MTQENVPISSSSKESIFKRARFGFSSLALGLLSLILSPFIPPIGRINPLWFPGGTATLPEQMGQLYGPIFYIAWGVALVALIVAIIGLIKDKSKIISAIMLVLSILMVGFSALTFLILANQ